MGIFTRFVLVCGCDAVKRCSAMPGVMVMGRLTTLGLGSNQFVIGIKIGINW